MKNEKGITLIALVITIIVMLILVGVTINIVINGGLFETAQDASSQMEEKAICEKIIALASWKDDGTIDVAATITEVEKEYDSVTNNGDGTYTIKGKTGEYKYEITSNKIAIAGDNGGEHQPNQYGFYEDVVYELNTQLDGHECIEYMLFGNDLVIFKGKAIIDGSSDGVFTSNNIQIKNNPTYEIVDGTQQIPGTVIEVDDNPTFKVEAQGKLSEVGCQYDEEGIDSYSVNDEELLEPKFDLDPDVIFAE